MNTEAKYTILFVDDDAFVVDMYGMKFTQAGHDFHPASSAGEALDILRGGLKPDAIVTDLLMPKMDGFEFLETVKKEDMLGDAAIIVLSNQSESEDITKARELGAVGQIIKANTIPTEVLQIITNLIAKHKNK